MLLAHVSFIIREAYDKISYDDTVWKEKELKIFITGGGRSLNAYKNISHRLNLIERDGMFLRPHQKRYTSVSWFNYELVKDRTPNRLVIAFGLSFSALKSQNGILQPVYTSSAEQTDDFSANYIGPEQV